MFGSRIRGGITQAVHQYAKANDKYMGDKFNPKEDSSFLQYLDMNNLYGWAMSQLLPTGGFNCSVQFIVQLIYLFRIFNKIYNLIKNKLHDLIYR